MPKPAPSGSRSASSAPSSRLTSTPSPSRIDAKAARARIAGWRAEFEERLGALVEIPTVSMDPACRPAMDRAAPEAGRLLGELGARVDVIDTGGAPLVVGRVTRDPS